MRKVLSPISEKRIRRIDWTIVSTEDGSVVDGGDGEDAVDIVSRSHCGVLARRYPQDSHGHKR